MWKWRAFCLCFWPGCLLKVGWDWITMLGALKKTVSVFLGILSQPAWKEKIMFILHFRLFWAEYFVMKNYFFVGWDDEWGGSMPSWFYKILPSPLCIVCFITFLAIYQDKFSLVPHRWDKIPGKTENVFFQGSPLWCQ